MTRRSLLLSERPDTADDDLAAIDYVLKLLDFKEDPQDYMPKNRQKRIFAKGEKRRLITETLKQADKPLTSREICIAILSGKEFDMTDTRRLKQTVTGVYIMLCREHEGGRVDRVEGWPVRWVTIPRSR